MASLKYLGVEVDFGTGENGSLTVVSGQTLTLTSDKNYTNVTVQNGGTLIIARPQQASFTASTTNLSTSLTVSSVIGTISIGSEIWGAHILDGTTITAGSGTSWTLSKAQNATLSTSYGYAFGALPNIKINGTLTVDAGGTIRGDLSVYTPLSYSASGPVSHVSAYNGTWILADFWTGGTGIYTTVGAKHGQSGYYNSTDNARMQTDFARFGYYDYTMRTSENSQFAGGGGGGAGVENGSDGQGPQSNADWGNLFTSGDGGTRHPTNPRPDFVTLANSNSNISMLHDGNVGGQGGNSTGASRGAGGRSLKLIARYIVNNGSIHVNGTNGGNGNAAGGGGGAGTLVVFCAEERGSGIYSAKGGAGGISSSSNFGDGGRGGDGTIQRYSGRMLFQGTVLAGPTAAEYSSFTGLDYVPDIQYVQTDNASSQTSGEYSTTLYWKHTCGTSNNRLLLVNIAITGGYTPNNTAQERSVYVRYGPEQATMSDYALTAIPLTYLDESYVHMSDNANADSPLNADYALPSPADAMKSEWWYLINPPSGDNYISVLRSQNSTMIGGAVSFVGVNQSNPFRSFGAHNTRNLYGISNVGTQSDGTPYTTNSVYEYYNMQLTNKLDSISGGAYCPGINNDLLYAAVVTAGARNGTTGATGICTPLSPLVTSSTGSWSKECVNASGKVLLSSVSAYKIPTSEQEAAHFISAKRDSLICCIALCKEGDSPDINISNTTRAALLEYTRELGMYSSTLYGRNNLLTGTSNQPGDSGSPNYTFTSSPTHYDMNDTNMINGFTGNYFCYTQRSTFVGSISGTTLTVTNNSSGATIAEGAMLSGTGVRPGTIIVGSYYQSLSTEQQLNVLPDNSTALIKASIAGTTMQVVHCRNGVLAIGQIVTGTGVTANSIITAFEAGSGVVYGSTTIGGPGTYTLSQSSTVGYTANSATNLTATMPNVTATGYTGKCYSSGLSTDTNGTYQIWPSQTVPANTTIYADVTMHTSWHSIRVNGPQQKGTYLKIFANNITFPLNGCVETAGHVYFSAKGTVNINGCVISAVGGGGAGGTGSGLRGVYSSGQSWDKISGNGNGIGSYASMNSYNQTRYGVSTPAGALGPSVQGTYNIRSLGTYTGGSRGNKTAASYDVNGYVNYAGKGGGGGGNRGWGGCGGGSNTEVANNGGYPGGGGHSIIADTSSANATGSGFTANVSGSGGTINAATLNTAGSGYLNGGSGTLTFLIISGTSFVGPVGSISVTNGIPNGTIRIIQQNSLQNSANTGTGLQTVVLDQTSYAGTGVRFSAAPFTTTDGLKTYPLPENYLANWSESTSATKYYTGISMGSGGGGGSGTASTWGTGARGGDGGGAISIDAFSVIGSGGILANGCRGLRTYESAASGMGVLGDNLANTLGGGGGGGSGGAILITCKIYNSTATLFAVGGVGGTVSYYYNSGGRFAGGGGGGGGGGGLIIVAAQSIMSNSLKYIYGGRKGISPIFEWANGAESGDQGYSRTHVVKGYWKYQYSIVLWL